MEVRLDLPDGQDVTPGTYVSVRIGESHKQSRLAKTKMHKLPKEACQETFGRVEIYRRVGTAVVRFSNDMSVESHELDIACENTDGEPSGSTAAANMHLKFSVRRLERQATDVTAEAHEKLRKSKGRLDKIRTYCGEHRLETQLAEALQDVLKNKPSDPRSYLTGKLMKRRLNSAPNLPPLPRASTEKMGSGTVTPKGSGSLGGSFGASGATLGAGGLMMRRLKTTALVLDALSLKQPPTPGIAAHNHTWEPVSPVSTKYLRAATQDKIFESLTAADQQTLGSPNIFSPFGSRMASMPGSRPMSRQGSGPNFDSLPEELSSGAAAQGSATALAREQVPVVELVMKLKNINHADLTSNPALVESFTACLKESVIANAGPGIKPEHVQIILSAGSVIAKVKIVPPSGVLAGNVAAKLDSKAVSTHVLEQVKVLPGIAEVTTGQIQVAVTDAPKVTRPPLRDDQVAASASYPAAIIPSGPSAAELGAQRRLLLKEIEELTLQCDEANQQRQLAQDAGSDDIAAQWQWLVEQLDDALASARKDYISLDAASANESAVVSPTAGSAWEHDCRVVT